jgi:cytochrome c556
MLFQMRSPKRLWAFRLSLLVTGIDACSQSPTIIVPAYQQFHLTATIADLMEGQIDPSADALWDSVAFIAAKSHTEERQPHTDAEWQAVRTHAITLVEATNLLSMPGRRVKNGDSPVGLGELSTEEIQKRIDASHDSFAALARALQEAALRALAAIDAKDAQGLMDAGGIIDEACEACHMTYWYPNQNRPRT